MDQCTQRGILFRRTQQQRPEVRTSFIAAPADQRSLKLRYTTSAGPGTLTASALLPYLPPGNYHQDGRYLQQPGYCTALQALGYLRGESTDRL